MIELSPMINAGGFGLICPNFRFLAIVLLEFGLGFTYDGVYFGFIFQMGFTFFWGFTSKTIVFYLPLPLCKIQREGGPRYNPGPQREVSGFPGFLMAAKRTH